jgi:hypothetical protein
MGKLLGMEVLLQLVLYHCSATHSHLHAALNQSIFNQRKAQDPVLAPVINGRM